MGATIVSPTYNFYSHRYPKRLDDEYNFQCTYILDQGLAFSIFSFANQGFKDLLCQQDRPTFVSIGNLRPAELCLVTNKYKIPNLLENEERGNRTFYELPVTTFNFE